MDLRELLRGLQTKYDIYSSIWLSILKFDENFQILGTRPEIVKL
jgi:hypothetical protein